MTPGEVGGWIFQNIWIVFAVIWVISLFGVGGSIYAFIKWAKRGLSQIFNPWFLLIIFFLILSSLFLFLTIQNLLSGWF